MKLVHWFVAGVLVAPLVLGDYWAERSAIASDLTRQLQQQPFGRLATSQRQDADRLFEEGVTRFQQGNLNAAITLWQAATEQYRLINDMEGQQRAFEYLSQAYQKQNKPVELEHALRQQLRFARARRDFPVLVSHYNQVGELLLARSSAVQSEKTFSEALRLAQDLKDVSGQGRSLTNLGLASLQQGHYAQAAAHLTQAIALQQQTPNVNGEAIAQNALGIAYRNLGESQKSAGAHLNALILARTSENFIAQDQAMTGLAIAYQNLGANQESRRWIDAQLVASSGTTTLARVTALRAMAEFYQRNGDLAMTDRYYRDAIATATQGGYAQAAQDLSQKLETLRRTYYLSPRRNG